VSVRSQPIARAYAACRALAQSHYENFPVASRLLPAFMRPHVAAVYAFARTADDIADEGQDLPDVRRARLRLWSERLHRAAAGALDDELRIGSPDALIVAATAHSVRTLDLPIALFDDLLSAFGQDITTTRYDSWTEVLDYCRRSANPIGRLVLRIARRQSDAADQSSDALCTALQLTNFWQDFGRDWRAGRLYVPQEISGPLGASEEDLAAGRVTAAWLAAVEACIDRTEHLFDRGRRVCDAVDGRLQFELRLTWLGGRRILSRVHAGRANLLSHRPTLGRADVPALVWSAVRWRAEAA
jgi:hydroxysqualene synthase